MSGEGMSGVAAHALEGLLWARLRRELTRLMDEFRGIAGVAVLDVMSGEEIALNGDETFPTASSIKIHILAQLLARAERGEVNLGERLKLDPGEMVLGSGVLAHLDGPVEMTLLDIAILMIIVSDNTATNICLRFAGVEETNQLLDTLGLTRTRVRRKMMDELAAVQEQENVSTPNEMVRMMALLRAGKPSETVAIKVLEILRKPKSSTLTDALPNGTIFANKPGYVDGARCDAGIVELSRRPYIVAIMSKYALESRGEHAGALVEIAHTIHRHFETLEKSNQYGRYVYLP
jgi:beta-lactamase class A